jgi:beta-1,4-mannooligosaccharide/beta-1,4-mannosyl-N-acetylglucosamine phosphorylase
MAEIASRASSKEYQSEEPLDPYLDRARGLFQRHPDNPILTPEDMPFACRSVCNPGVCRIDDEVLLLLRVIKADERSHLHVARSADGIGGWRIETTPLLSPDIDAAWYDDRGCEDPRITYLEDRCEYIITYVGVSRFGSGVCLASTKDFRTVTRLGMAIHPYNKDAVLFPRRFNGKYRMLHRPTAGPLENIWISESEDLIHWGNPCCVLEERDQPGWDSGKVGAGPPPFEVNGGWALIFHGVMQVDGGWEYRFGWALLDRDAPNKVVYRFPEWVFGPVAPYEKNGDKPGIIFPTGTLLTDDTLSVYYGAADTCVALATARRSDLRDFRREVSPLLHAASDDSCP